MGIVGTQVSVKGWQSDNAYTLLLLIFSLINGRKLNACMNCQQYLIEISTVILNSAVHFKHRKLRFITKPLSSDKVAREYKVIKHIEPRCCQFMPSQQAWCCETGPETCSSVGVQLPVPKSPLCPPWPARQFILTASPTSLFQVCKTCWRKGLCTKGFPARNRSTSCMNMTFMTQWSAFYNCLASLHKTEVLVLPQDTNIPVIVLQERECIRCKAEREMKAK